jgi:hypothetical protein
MPRARTSAVLTAGLGGVVLGELLGGQSQPAYAVVLVAAVVTGSLLSAGLLWSRNGFEARLGAAVLAIATGIGQLLLLVTGGPGGSTTGTDRPAAGVALALALAILALVGLDARATTPERPVEHPYAL